MKPIIVAAILALLAACGSDTGEANVCEKSYPNKCPLPGAPTPDHYGPIHK